MVPDPIGTYVRLANRNRPEAPSPMGLKLSNQLGLVASWLGPGGLSRGILDLVGLQPTAHSWGYGPRLLATHRRHSM